MSDNVTLSDILEAIKIKWDVYDFLDRFDLTFDDVVDKFAYVVKKEIDSLAVELELEKEPEEYEDR